MKKPHYPLSEIYTIKEKRLEEAEKELKKAKETLREEEKKLEEFKERYKTVLKLKDEKIRKYLDQFQEGMSSTEIHRHTEYIKNVVNEELKIEKKKVDDQSYVVVKAKEKVEEARKVHLARQMEVEKLKLHKEEWKKEIQKEEIKSDSSLTDELGMNIHGKKKKPK